jgi:hypothetical protein
VIGLITGVRGRVEQPGQFPDNWVHIGVSTGEHWAHIRQNKHHRWSLDEGQIYQYHLGGALHPHFRWWEAMQVPRQSVQFVEFGEGGTLVSLVCEDLAQIDDVADVIRSVGPMIVITPLLDGPQLKSRWAARYASVMADDPGSAVLTLTSLGMAQRSRPHGHKASAVVALWKDPGQGVREIPLESGAQGVLLSASADRATRRSSDGRPPVDDGSEFFNMSIYQVRASATGSGPRGVGAEPRTPPLLGTDELTVLVSWAEAVAEALALAPERVQSVQAEARAGVPWRGELGITEPSPQLAQAIDAIDKAVQSVTVPGQIPTLDGVLDAIRDSPVGEPESGGLVRRVLQSALEQRHARHGRDRGFTRARRDPSSSSRRPGHRELGLPATTATVATLTGSGADHRQPARRARAMRLPEEE